MSQQRLWELGSWTDHRGLNGENININPSGKKKIVGKQELGCKTKFKILQ